MGAFVIVKEMTVKPNYTYHATLLRVIDGDTIEVMLDLGHDIFVKRDIRILGIDTSELNSKSESEREKAQAAKEYLIDTLTKELTVRTVKPDSFGRWLGDVWYKSVEDYVSVAEELIKRGFEKTI